ncbi:MAG: DUF106 domain-containing protein [Nanoarchaeota archaeon]|nr:DUF106 domain-containing protein [Nanoarchaeota archaeon]
MDNEGKGSFKGIFIAMFASLIIASMWNSVPIFKNTAHAVLNPTLGVLLNWNYLGGMSLIVLVMALITTLTQKYGTDQETMRELKKEQKELQAKIKSLERGSKEYNELSMKSLEMMSPMMKLSMRPVIYTAIPFILLFRWFSDFFIVAGNIKFLGLSWFWFYLIGSILFSSILRKVFKVV